MIHAFEVRQQISWLNPFKNWLFKHLRVNNDVSQFSDPYQRVDPDLAGIFSMGGGSLDDRVGLADKAFKPIQPIYQWNG